MKHIHILCLIFILFIVPTGKGQSQEKETFKFSEKQIGIAAGMSTGFGLSYRQYINRYGFQICLAPIKDEDNSLYSLGGTFLYKIKDADHINFFLYQGNHFIYTESKGNYYDWNTMEQIYYKNVDREMVSSAGFGIEILMGNFVTTNLMTGFATFESYQRLSMTVEIGFFFRFKKN